MEKKWPKDESNAKDDPYEALVLAYNMEMDQLVEVNKITSEVEEDDFATCMDERRMESNDEKKNTMARTPSLKRCHDR